MEYQYYTKITGDSVVQNGHKKVWTPSLCFLQGLRRMAALHRAISNNWFTNSRVPEVGPISKLRKHLHILGFPEMGGYLISSSIYKSIFHEIKHLFWGTPNSNLTSSALSCGKARLSWWKDLGSSTFSSTLVPI